MAAKRDYYKVLGVSKTASESELKSAFRKLSMKWHPDMQHGKSDVEKEEAKQKFQEIAEAYEVLSNKDKRAAYDQFGFDSPGNSGFSSSSMDINEFLRRHAGMFTGMGGFDPFEDFAFGGGRRGQHQKQPPPDPTQPEDGSHVQIKMPISFKESVFGCTKTFEIKLQKECPNCHGTGVKDGAHYDECPVCHGAGVQSIQQRTAFGISIQQSVCQNCGGSGYVVEHCKKCNGSRRVPDTKEIEVKIPAGIADGQKLRLTGKGQCGVCGGASGNLYIIVRVEQSDVFVRDSNNLDIGILDFPVDGLTASLGGEIDVPTLRGVKKLNIPAGTETGKSFTMKGEGINAGNETGDLIIKVTIEPIVSLTKDQKKELEKFKNSLSKQSFKHANDFMQKAAKFYN